MPPTWDPPRLLLVVGGGLHVVVGTLGVVGVVVDGGVWLLDSSIWLRQPERKEKGKKGEESNREYSSKVLASKELHYICMGICVRRPYQWTELQNARIEGEGLAYQRLASSSSSKHLAACRRVKNSI